MHLRFTQRHHHWTLPAGMLLAALVALCAWGSWVAAQPDLGAFLLPGAHDIRYAPVGPGMQSVLFTGVYPSGREAQQAPRGHPALGGTPPALARFSG